MHAAVNDLAQTMDKFCDSNALYATVKADLLSLTHCAGD